MSEPVIYYNRYTDQIEKEAIYGERFLRWAYENPLGRVVTSLLIKRGFFSRWYGRKMEKPESKNRIEPFIQKYGISVEDMASPPSSFANFNEFFSRRLKPTARPIAADDKMIVFPADGRHFAIPDLLKNDGIFVKGIHFDLQTLLGDDTLAARYERGSMLISRLCPVDYHRFHFPWDGVPEAAKGINGPLYSVNPIALRKRPSLLWENERCVTRLKTSNLGEIALMQVGATCVGTVVLTHPPLKPAHKGDELGYFLFGGSCCITLFEPGRIKFANDLLKHSAEGREVYAEMGDAAAKRLK